MRRLRCQQLIGLIVAFVLGFYMVYVLWLTLDKTSVDRELLQTSTESSTSRRRESLIKFKDVTFNPDLDNLTFDNVHLYPCSQPAGAEAGSVVDLMCVPRPNYLPTFKNPCYRDGSQTLKCMPYYNLLGFDKCGTTDLSARMIAHPSIHQPNAYMGKEIYYWAWRRLGIFMKKTTEVMTLDGYALTFRDAAAKISAREVAASQPIVGDGTPIDSWDFRGWPLEPQNKDLSEPKVSHPHHIRHIMKNPRFIIIMRNPSERLYSDYLIMEDGDSPERFDKDVTVAIDMMNECMRTNDSRLCFFSEHLYHNMPTRLHIGCYSMFLREWLSVFHRKHFLFLRTEDYNSDVRGTLEEVFAFLGVETLPESMMDVIVNQKRVHETKQKTRAGPMFRKTKEALDEFYAPCNAYLSELLGEEKYLWNSA